MRSLSTLFFPLVEVQVEAHLTLQPVQLLQPRHALPGGLPGVGSHAKEGHNVQDLLYLPQVPGGGDGIAEQPAGAEDAGKLLCGQGGEDVHQHVGLGVGDGQVVDRRRGELPLGQALRGPAEGGPGQVHSSAVRA